MCGRGKQCGTRPPLIYKNHGTILAVSPAAVQKTSSTLLDYKTVPTVRNVADPHLKPDQQCHEDVERKNTSHRVTDLTLLLTARVDRRRVQPPLPPIASETARRPRLLAPREKSNLPRTPSSAHSWRRSERRFAKSWRHNHDKAERLLRPVPTAHKLHNLPPLCRNNLPQSQVCYNLILDACRQRWACTDWHPAAQPYLSHATNLLPPTRRARNLDDRILCRNSHSTLYIDAPHLIRH